MSSNRSFSIRKLQTGSIPLPTSFDKIHHCIFRKQRREDKSGRDISGISNNRFLTEFEPFYMPNRIITSGNLAINDNICRIGLEPISPLIYKK